MSPMEKLEEIVVALQVAEDAGQDGCDCGTDEPGTCLSCCVKRALTLARELKAGAVDGFEFMGQFHEHEPEDHDGPALLITEATP